MLCNRASRPRSNGTESLPNTIGINPAVQANRRASPAEIRPPVSNPATPIPSNNASRLNVTTNVNALP